MNREQATNETADLVRRVAEALGWSPTEIVAAPANTAAIPSLRYYQLGAGPAPELVFPAKAESIIVFSSYVEAEMAKRGMHDRSAFHDAIRFSPNRAHSHKYDPTDPASRAVAVLRAAADALGDNCNMSVAKKRENTMDSEKLSVLSDKVLDLVAELAAALELASAAFEDARTAYREGYQHGYEDAARLFEPEGE